ncbi:MAG TPA: hypothetical protein VL443_29950 [Cyclobacteriaceae bacterium]|jgi:hypothetical protein|nr:hypothetical protein [Cyclobacteriaceae bacterium]
MFVKAEDFDRLPYNITGLDKLSNGVFDDFVSYHEEEELRKTLGNLFYDAFASGVNALPSGLDLFQSGTVYNVGGYAVYVIDNVADYYLCIQDTDGTQLPTDAAFWTKQPSNRWVRLTWGDTYLYYGRPQKWYGMKRLVVPLIYSLWTKYTYDNQAQFGVTVLANENSTTVSPSQRIARAWNKYCRLCAGDFPNVVDPNYLVWPELENSIFGYLYINDTTWNDLTVGVPGFTSFRAYLAYSFNYPGKTNVFGI